MDSSLYYLSLNRQRGLQAELNSVATNVANINTTGYRREQMVFSEFIDGKNGGESLSMADMNTRFASSLPGEIRETGGVFDLAIEGPGYFLAQDNTGLLMTRGGAFLRSSAGNLVTADGASVLDLGQAEIFLPPDAREIKVSPDGTLSADGVALTQLAVVTAPPEGQSRVGAAGFRVPAAGFTALEDIKVRQGAVEGSNVDPVLEIARLIEITRAYDQTQELVNDEDERIRNTIETLGRV